MLDIHEFDAFLFDVMGTIIRHHDDTDVIVTPGIKEFLDFLKEEEKATAVVTSLTRERLDFYFKLLDLDAYFDVIVTRDDISHTKPSPEPYNLALELLGVTPDKAVAFEDSVNGVAAAKDAGILTVLIRGEYTEAELEDSADLVIRDFSQLLELLRNGDSDGVGILY